MYGTRISLTIGLLGVTMSLVLGVVLGGWYFATYVVLDAQRRFLLPPPRNLGTLPGE